MQCSSGRVFAYALGSSLVCALVVSGSMVRVCDASEPVVERVAETRDLEQLRIHGDFHAQRRHVWDLLRKHFAQGNGSTIAFDSWYGEDDVFSTSSAVRTTSGIRQFSRLVPGNTSGIKHRHLNEFPDAPVFNYTLYNEAAYQHIRRYRLNRSARLRELRLTGPKDLLVEENRSIPPFPPDAVVLKSIWWPVSATLPTSLPMWDPESNSVHDAGNSYLQWRRSIVVDPRPRQISAAGANSTIPARLVAETHPIGVDAFFYFKVSARYAARANNDSEARRASVIALGRPLQAGDLMLLVGVNLAAKEIENWVWVTLWWHDQPTNGEFAADRPPSTPVPLSHYLMQTAFDSDYPAESDGSPHICFNPWLEGRFPNGGHGSGAVSNCLTCHSRASYPAINFLPVSRGSSSRITDPAFAPGRLRTGFLWSIALHGTP